MLARYQAREREKPEAALGDPGAFPGLGELVTLNVRLVAVAKVLHRSVLEHGADELFVGKLGADGGVALTVILYKS